MTLAHLIYSQPSNDLISYLNTALDNASVKISYWGLRMVTIAEHSDYVEIDSIVQKIIQADAFKIQNNPSLEKRAYALSVCQKILKLYKKSTELLQNTWIYSFLVPLIESRPNPAYNLLGAYEMLFTFQMNEFSKYWPEDLQNTSICIIKIEQKAYKLLIAEEQKVARLCQRQFPQIFQNQSEDTWEKVDLPLEENQKLNYLSNLT
jgi:hypothetical protein